MPDVLASSKMMKTQKDHYKGTLVNGQKEGQGVFEYPNPFFKYQGGWVGGAKHGRGVLEMWDGTRYEGSFLNGEITGVGTKTYPDAACYEGEFVDGEFNGRGSFYSPLTGERYEGDWVGNRAHGRGILSFPRHKLEYTGEFCEHRVSGYGRLTYANNMVWEGTFEDGMLTGPSCKAWSMEDDIAYEGGMQASMRHGVGVLTSGASRWEGDWKDDELVHLAVPDPKQMGTPADIDIARTQSVLSTITTEEFNGREFHVTVHGLAIAEDGETGRTVLRDEHTKSGSAGLSLKDGKYQALAVSVQRMRYPMMNGMRLSLHRSDVQRMSVPLVRKSVTGGSMAGVIPTPKAYAPAPPEGEEPAHADVQTFVEAAIDGDTLTATMYLPHDMKHGIYAIKVTDTTHYPMVYPPSPVRSIELGCTRPEGPVQKPLKLPTLLEFEPPKVKDLVLVVELKK